MASETKIVGIRRNQGEADPEDAQTENAAGDEERNAPSDDPTESSDFSWENERDSADIGEDDWDEYAEEDTAASSAARYIAPTLLVLAVAGWSAFFLWANRDIFATLLTPKAGITLFTDWCLPVLTAIILYLLYMRNSTREAARFTDISSSLRHESEELEERLKTVNNELSIAREFLTSETRELETLGSQSSAKLSGAASDIRSALGDGLKKMTQLDNVGAAAFKNLEHLREHLPVVINTAKDVTNQIGNAGRTTQTEMTAMVATLKRVGEVGSAANKNLEDLQSSSQQSLDRLAHTAEAVEVHMSAQLEHSEAGARRIADVLKDTSNEVIKALKTARIDLAKDASETSSALKSDLQELETTLSTVRAAAFEEEERLKVMASDLNDNIALISANIRNLDNESGDKTAKLAFAMTALEQNSSSLKQALEGGYGVADGLIERIERLLLAIDSSSRELDETLPAAFDRMNEKSESSIFLFNQMNDEVTKMDAQSDALSSKFAETNKILEGQRSSLENLSDLGAAQTDGIIGKIQALSTSIQDVREQNEALAESSGEKLISALLQVKETAKQASEHSRAALEKSLTASADKFEQVSEEALDRIIDEKIGSIAPKLEEAVSNAVATTQSTASHLTSQLNAIEEMTTNLEQRILFAKEKAEQSSEENFTRRVALLTESLNSTAIDVTKLLSNEVTDTEWAAYLKGDRGIFARRAVRLLDAGEVREILAEYDANSEFREHVNRYIHDFETMLRGVLSTRDGSAISVTLLSSDIGKLYVALAQAIERLRN